MQLAESLVEWESESHYTNCIARRFFCKLLGKEENAASLEIIREREKVIQQGELFSQGHKLPVRICEQGVDWIDKENAVF